MPTHAPCRTGVPHARPPTPRTQERLQRAEERNIQEAGNTNRAHFPCAGLLGRSAKPKGRVQERAWARFGIYHARKKQNGGSRRPGAWGGREAAENRVKIPYSAVQTANAGQNGVKYPIRRGANHRPNRWFRTIMTLKMLANKSLRSSRTACHCTALRCTS